MWLGELSSVHFLNIAKQQIVHPLYILIAVVVFVREVALEWGLV